jgi:hypothetical protein
MTRPIAIVLAITGAVLVSGFCMLVWAMGTSTVTTSAVSPDGQYRAELLDRKAHMIDRNFRVRVVDADGRPRIVFDSPDESPNGIGQERFLWSQDGQRLLLVGHRFWVRDGAELTNGELLYLLYDVESGAVWCNSDQQGPPFDLAELEGYDFGETLTLKP